MAKFAACDDDGDAGACVLLQCGWYWGSLSFDDAEERLCDLADGSFLVRDSSDDRYILSLSFRSQSSTHHTRIEHYKGTAPTSQRAPMLLSCVGQKSKVTVTPFSATST